MTDWLKNGLRVGPTIHIPREALPLVGLEPSTEPEVKGTFRVVEVTPNAITVVRSPA